MREKKKETEIVIEGGATWGTFHIYERKNRSDRGERRDGMEKGSDDALEKGMLDGQKDGDDH